MSAKKIELRGGPCNNISNFRFLGASPILSKLIFKNLDIDPYSIKNYKSHSYDETAYTGILLFNALRAKGGKLKQLRLCLNLSETFLPSIQDDSFLSTNDARQNLVDVFTVEWKDLKNDPIYKDSILFCQQVAWNQSVANPFYGVDPQNVTDDDGKLALISVKDMTAKIVVDILIHAADNLPENLRMKTKVPIVELILSFAKQGNVTQRSLNKMLSELVVSNPSIATAVELDNIRLIWTAFYEKLDDSVAENLFAKWLEILPGEAKRFKWTIDQAAGAGLTSIESIGKALVSFPNFNWKILLRLFPQEHKIVLEALKLVKNNKYYGYKKDLGVVKTTNYPSFTYTCVKLLIDVGGETSLTNYKGAPTVIKFQDVVDRMIAEYRASGVAEKSLKDPQTDDETQIIKDLTQAAASVKLS